MGGATRAFTNPHTQAINQGKRIRLNPQESNSMDAATAHTVSQVKANRDDVSGNPENVGFVEQVGSHSATANGNAFAKQDGSSTVQEDITSPSLTDVAKKKLGMETTAGEDKQNRGVGVGVTGTGTGTGKPWFALEKRKIWTSAVFGRDTTTENQVCEESRRAKYTTTSEPNGYQERHTSTVKGGKSGKGTATKDPSPLSRQVRTKRHFKNFQGIHPGMDFIHFKNKGSTPKGSMKFSNNARGFSTSARVQAGEKNKATHTAESYFKDVDSTPPSSSKTHQVDSSVTGAHVRSATEPQTGEFVRRGPGDAEYQTVQSILFDLTTCFTN